MVWVVEPDPLFLFSSDAKSVAFWATRRLPLSVSGFDFGPERAVGRSLDGAVSSEQSEGRTIRALAPGSGSSTVIIGVNWIVR